MRPFSPLCDFFWFGFSFYPSFVCFFMADTVTTSRGAMLMVPFAPSLRGCTRIYLSTSTNMSHLYHIMHLRRHHLNVVVITVQPLRHRRIETIRSCTNVSFTSQMLMNISDFFHFDYLVLSARQHRLTQVRYKELPRP
jgi:hypothetical protein